MRAVLPIAGLLLVLGSLIGADEPKGSASKRHAIKVPKNASVLKVSDDVTLQHWMVADPDNDRILVYGLPAVEEWPEKTWGFQVTLTPVPYCCGAKRTYMIWRKYERPRPKLLGEVREGSRYTLATKFK